MDWFDYFSKMPVVTSMITLFVSSLFLAIQSSFFLEVVKITYEKVFTKNKFDARIGFFVNIGFLCLTGTAFSFTANSDLSVKFLGTFWDCVGSISYIVQVIIYSCILSILVYTTIIKLFFSGIYILTDKIGVVKDTVSVQRLMAKMELQKKQVLFRTLLEEKVLLALDENPELVKDI